MIFLFFKTSDHKKSYKINTFGEKNQTDCDNQSGRKNTGKKKPGSVSFAPEFSINQHLSLKNVITNNMTDRLRKNEIVVSLKPFKDGRMNLDLGAGQTYSYQNEPTKSQLNFSTNFKF